MIKISINGKAYLIPHHPGEATVEFYERIYKIDGQSLELPDFIALLLGITKWEVERVTGREYGHLYGVANSVLQWLPDWIKRLDKAPVNKSFRIGKNEYKRPKSWVNHQYRTQLYLEQYLSAQGPTLVRDVVALYMVEEVIGPNWNDEDLKALADFVATSRAIDTVPLFFYACKSLDISRPKSLGQLFGQILASKLSILPAWAHSPRLTT